MASNINPNNIDGAYPIAGQDNSSQGFRTNFTNIKTNFTTASTEISDLQNKVIVKSGLVGVTLDNNMNNTILSNAQIKGFRQTVYNHTSTTVTVDFLDGHVQTINASPAGSITVSFDSTWPTSAGTIYSELKLVVTITNVAHTLTLPSEVAIGPGVKWVGIDTSGDPEITFPETGTYTLHLSTIDSGGTVTLDYISLPDTNITTPLQLNSSEIETSDGAISLLNTTTLLETGASALNMTLADGTEGQIKIIAVKTKGVGDAIVTVATPAWGGTGTITMNAVAEAVTLQFIDGKWYCVGNNGAAFA
jgi:hypothetical protein